MSLVIKINILLVTKPTNYYYERIFVLRKKNLRKLEKLSLINLAEFNPCDKFLKIPRRIKN